MTTHLVIMTERTTHSDELERYTEKSPLAREGRCSSGFAIPLSGRYSPPNNKEP